MPELSLHPVGRSRKAYGRFLQSLQDPGRQVALAAALGVSESTISRIKNERMEECLALLYCAGFKVVAAEKVCVTPEALAFMRQITVRVLSSDEQSRELFGEDE